MRCIICCSNYIFALIQERKAIIKYYKTYGITILKKHVDAYHSINWKKFKEEVNNVRSVEKWPAKKKPNLSIYVIINFIFMKYFFKKMMCNKKIFYKTLTFWLWKITCLFSLWRVFGSNILFYIHVFKWASFLKDNFLKTYCLTWWKKQNKNMFCQNSQIVSL